MVLQTYLSSWTTALTSIWFDVTKSLSWVASMAAKSKRISEDKTFHVGYAVLHTSCSERPIFMKGCTYKHAWDVSMKSFPPFWFEAGIPRLYLDKCGTLYFQNKHFRPFLNFIQFLKSMKWDRVHTLFGPIIQGDLKEFRDTIAIFKDCFHHYHVTPDSSFQFSQNVDTTTMNLNFLQGPSILFTDFQGLKV